MKALILAAGLGTRLRPLTNNKPKSLVEVNGVPILFKQIDNLRENGIEDIIIIAGFKADVLIDAVKRHYDDGIIIIENEIYETTNNMYSAYLAKNKLLGEEFLLMNADVFFDSSIITELCDNSYVNAIVVEKDVYNSENMKITCIDGCITEIGKHLKAEESYGVSIDVYKFSQEASNVFFTEVCKYIEIQQDVNQWTEVAINAIFGKTNFKPCSLKGRWMEIDNYDDLEYAERIFND